MNAVASNQLGLTGPRFTQLDGLRGLAILMVVLYHSTELIYSEVTWIRVVLAIPWMGWAGVDLFFVLSGYLITRILLVHRGAPNYFRAFYGRRILRIFPLYYSLLIFYLIVVPQLGLFSGGGPLWTPNSDREAIWYWVFLGNFHAGLDGHFNHAALGITWSLAIEEQFYLVWPQLVSRLRVERLKKVCCAVVVGSLLMRLVAVGLGANWILTYTVTPFRLDGLAVGAWIAARVYQDGGFDAIAPTSNRLLRWALGAVGLIVGLLVVDPHLLGVETGFTLLGHPLMQTLGYSALAIAGGAVLIRLLSADEHSVWRRVFEAPLLTRLGVVSYGLYLVHVPVIHVVATWVYHPADSEWNFAFEQLLYYFAVLVPAVMLAALSWWAFESRWLSLRRYLPFQASRFDSRAGSATGCDRETRRWDCLFGVPVPPLPVAVQIGSVS